MGERNSFDVLSDITDHYESKGGTVRDVQAAMSQATGGVLKSTIEVTVPLCGSDGLDEGLALEDASLTEDGALAVEFTASDLLTIPSTGRMTVLSEESFSVTEGGEICLDIDLTICPPGLDQHSGDVDEGPQPPRQPAPEGIEQRRDRESEFEETLQRDESVPPYEDTDYLEALYEACDTFQQMSERIEMEVSAETVRRYMIEAGIHDPETYETRRREQNDEEETESSGPDDPIETIPDDQLLTDGIGLPPDVTITDVADAVVDSRSAHEVTRKLGLTEEETRRLLRQLNLLDLVLHRVGGDAGQEATYEAVAARIRQRVPEEA
jgi:hypothetical protein